MYIVIIFGLVFVAAGLFLLWQGVKDFRASRESQKWLPMEGQITESIVQVTRRRKKNDYYPKVAYTYSVLGETYTCKGVALGAIQGSSSQAKIQAQVEQYPLGQRVVVYYNPHRPAQATLEPGVTKGAWGTLVMGVISSVTGIFVLIIALTVANS